VRARTEDANRRMLRARDAMDRDFALPLDIPSLASIACVSESTFIRTFDATFGETPHRYLQRRRIERAMYLLRTTDRDVTTVCMEVGFSSLGSFSTRFRDQVGWSPSEYRADAVDRTGIPPIPGCVVLMWTRPHPDGQQSGRSARSPGGTTVAQRQQSKEER